MWQRARAELHSQGLEVITVAMDSGGAAAAGEWIRAAAPEHPALIDQRHRVAELYNMVNVPTTVWIDEQGRIARPNEPGWASDAFRRMRDPEQQAAIRDEIAARRRRYLAAVRDWVAKGAASPHVLSDADFRRRAALPSFEHALAAAHFRLGEYLHAQGHGRDAIPHFQEAQRLRPESWNYKRQAWSLADAERDYRTSFWSEVEKLADQPYYAPSPLAD